MAKTRTKTKPDKTTSEPKSDVTPPEDAHRLFGIVGPYGEHEEPIPTNGYVTFWDPGCSLLTMRQKQPSLFSYGHFLEGQAFAKLSDSWKYRQINLTVSGLDEPFDAKTPDLPLARELVTYLVLAFLKTGEKIEIPRLRCRDVMPSGRRVCVGPWFPSGLEICNVSDRWTSPNMGYCALYTPALPKKK